MAIADIIKYEGDNSTFIWKHPCEDFNTTSQLIVHESQEAVFFANVNRSIYSGLDDTRLKHRTSHCYVRSSTFRREDKHCSIVRSILSIRPSRWQSVGVQTQRFSM